MNDNEWYQGDVSSGGTGGGSTGGNDFFFDEDVQRKPAHTVKRGGWHVMLTLLALLFCAAASVGVAFLTQNMDKRPALLLGATFATPALAVMIATLLVEMVSASMVPRYSQKGQLGVAAVTVLCCFIVGCFGETVSGFTKPVAVAQQPNYVILLDKSGSMRGDRNTQSVDAVTRFMQTLPDNANLGVVAFDDELRGVSNIGPLTQEKRAENQRVVKVTPSGLTYFVPAIERALTMIETSGLPAGSEKLILLVTDANDNISMGDRARLAARVKQNNARVSVLIIDYFLEGELLNLVNETGGQVFTVNDVSTIYQDIVTASQLINQPVESNDVVRDAGKVQKSGKDEINWLSMGMMVLEGLIIGVALMLMTSRQGQRRFQPILSVVMGVAAGLILNFLHLGQADVWLQEAVAFSCYGVVFMTKNK